MGKHEKRKKAANVEASEETLQVMYITQWKDLHHCRNQDWKLCNLVIVGLLIIGGLKIFGELPSLQRILSLVFTIVSLLAVGVTERHRTLFKEKMNAIRELEKLLGIPALFEPKKRGIKYLKFKVQNMLITIYLLFALFFLYLACT